MKTVELEQEDDGRWIAEATWIPGAMVYGRDIEEAVRFLSSYLDWLKTQEGTNVTVASPNFGWSHRDYPDYK